MFKLKPFIFLSLFYFSTVGIAAEWNGVGPIKSLYIYPSYAVVVQGNVSGGPLCTNSEAWSFSWSDFDEQAQNRIQGILVSAYISQIPIQAVVDTTICGPENKKKFTGQIQLP